MTKTTHNLYHHALRADLTWQAELEAIYGNQANEARYDWRGKCTPTLRVLKHAFVEAMERYTRAVRTPQVRACR